MAQVHGLGPRVGGRLALFYIYRVNRVYGALINNRITIIIIIIIIIIIWPYRRGGACGAEDTRQSAELRIHAPADPYS